MRSRLAKKMFPHENAFDILSRKAIRGGNSAQRESSLEIAKRNFLHMDRASPSADTMNLLITSKSIKSVKIFWLTEVLLRIKQFDEVTSSKLVVT